MPLPAALLQRLQKRGLVDDDSKKEEVFAEDYDESYVEGANAAIVEPKKPPAVTQSGPIYDLGVLVHEQSNCRNQFNLYHKCAAYCFERYGRKKFNFDPISAHLRDKMLKKYPLPSHWMEVGDPSTGRFYYWNTRNDEVCWLSPLHPRAKITKSDEVLREQMILDKEVDSLEKNANSGGKFDHSDNESDYEDNGDRRRAPGRRRRDSSSSNNSSDSESRYRHRKRQHGSRDSDRSYEDYRRRRRSSETDSAESERDDNEDGFNSRRYDSDGESL